MKILFIGGYFDSNLEIEILRYSKGSIHYAANLYQKKIIDGLRGQDNVENISVISAPFISNYPNGYKKIYSENQKFSDEEIKYVDFVNIPFIKNLSRMQSIKNAIAEISSDYDLIIIYSAHLPLLLPAMKYAKKNNIKTITIIPDLPEYMNLSKKTLLYKGLKYIDNYFIRKQLNLSDAFILLTNRMVEKLPIKSKPYVIIEGIFDNVYENSSNKNNLLINIMDKNKIHILYAGTLNKVFGALNLVEAFSKVNNDNYILHICGQGEDADEIERISKTRGNIVFHGQLPNSNVIALMESSKILINPRPNDAEYTAYSFPSKIIEYMGMGKAVFCYKLDGIPKEYDKYLHYFKTNDLVEELRNIFNISIKELEVIGDKNKEFVKKNKSKENTASKIIKLYESIEDL